MVLTESQVRFLQSQGILQERMRNALKYNQLIKDKQEKLRSIADELEGEIICL